MKHFYFFAMLMCIFINTSSAQDQCPNFKIGHRKVNLRFIPNWKKIGVCIKFSPSIIFSIAPIASRTENTTTTNGTVTAQSSSSTGNFAPNLYLGYFLPIAFEKKIAKKSTLEFSVAYEYIGRQSFADTNKYKYPTVDMEQFKNSDGGVNSYDYIESRNIKFAMQYRYYFKKEYKGFYIGPIAAISYGKNLYLDEDNNNQNINYGFAQKNLVFNGGVSLGYQFLIKKHFILDVHFGTLFKSGLNLKKKYNDDSANDEGLRTKYPNTGALNQNYRPGVFTGIGIGYKF